MSITHQKSIWASCLFLGLEAYDASVFLFLTQGVRSIFSTQGMSHGLFIVNIFLVIFARFFGGLYLGHLADKYGRKPLIVWCMILTSLFTFSFALIPLLKNYVPLYLILFIVCFRVLQGAIFGASVIVTTSYLFELAPKGRRGFFAAFAQGSQEIGIMLAAVVAFCFYSLPVKDWMSDSTWRLPFISGLLSVLCGLCLRAYLIESPHIHFKPLPALKTVIKRFKTQIIKIFMIAPLEVVSFYLFRVYVFNQAYNYLHISIGSILFLSLLASLTTLVFIFIGSALSDLVGRKPVLISGAIGMLLLSWPTLVLINHPGETHMVFMRMFVGQLMIGLFIGLYRGAFAGLIAEMFPAKIRVTGCALSYNLGFSIMAGIFPLANFFPSVIHQSHSVIGGCLTISACVALIVIGLSIQETYKIEHEAWIEK